MDTSPIIISMKTAIVAIVFTFILGLFAARWILYRKSEAAKIFWDGRIFPACIFWLLRSSRKAV